MKAHVQLFVLMLMVGVLAVSVAAKDVPQPTGDVILTITGCALTNIEGGFAMDEAMLRALPQVKYFVIDPWMGDNTYGGVLLSTVLEYVGFPLGAEQVVTVASDDKEVSVKIADMLAYPILLVMDDADGALISALGGPIKLAFPYDAYPGLEEIYNPDAWNWFVGELRIEY